MELKTSQEELTENETQLAIHEQAYENHLTKIKHAGKKLSELRDKISNYDAELKMSRAEAEMAELDNNFNMEVTTDFGQIGQMVQDQISLNRAKARVATDLSGEGIEVVERDRMSERVLADDALRDFEVQQGLITAQTEEAKRLEPPTSA